MENHQTYQYTHYGSLRRRIKRKVAESLLKNRRKISSRIQEVQKSQNRLKLNGLHSDTSNLESSKRKMTCCMQRGIHKASRGFLSRNITNQKRRREMIYYKY
jgi:hypothetical protein